MHGTRNAITRWLLPVVLVAFAFAAALTSPAGADESVPPAGAAEPPVVAPEPVPPEQPPQEPQGSVDPAPAPPEPAPEPQPQPEPPPAEPPVLELPPAPPADEPAPVPHDRGAAHDSSGTTTAPAAEPVFTTFAAAAPQGVAPVTPAGSTDSTTVPLGWDVYDDTLFVDNSNGNGGAGGYGGEIQAAFGHFARLGVMVQSVERQKHQDAAPASRAEPVPNGGSGPGGSGPGQGPSLGLAGGGSGAGIALLTLLGIAGGWLLFAPHPRRASLTSTATWRPSAYVPPIEQPG